MKQNDGGSQLLGIKNTPNAAGTDSGGATAAVYEAARQEIMTGKRSRSSANKAAYFKNAFRSIETPDRPAPSTSADNKHNTVFDDLPYGGGGMQQADLIEMDQRQRIFEEVIIARIKVVQDFVKNRYAKLSKHVKDIKDTQLITGGSLREDQFNLAGIQKGGHSIEASQAGAKGTIIEVVEEALKWRLEANNRKQLELMDELIEKVGEQKRFIEVLSAESNTEFMEIKNQIVEAASDVLL